MLCGMKGYMFQSRTGALLFVGITLIGVASLVGTEGEGGTLKAATAQIEQQGAELRGQAEAMANPDPDPDPIMVDAEPEFVEDEDLVLNPTGIDPTPMEPNPEANDHEEVVVVESSSEIVSE